MSDILSRLAGLAGTGPEIMLEVLATVVDGLGTGAEFSGEQLDRLGELTQTLADKIRGAKEAKEQQ